MARKQEGKLYGYVVVNTAHQFPLDVPRPVICDEDCLVFATYTEAKESRDMLREEHNNPHIEVMAVHLMPNQ
jgi:hypothetical protein